MCTYETFLYPVPFVCCQPHPRRLGSEPVDHSQVIRKVESSTVEADVTVGAQAKNVAVNIRARVGVAQTLNMGALRVARPIRPNSEG